MPRPTTFFLRTPLFLLILAGTTTTAATTSTVTSKTTTSTLSHFAALLDRLTHTLFVEEVVQVARCAPSTGFVRTHAARSWVQFCETRDQLYFYSADAGIEHFFHTPGPKDRRRRSKRFFTRTSILELYSTTWLPSNLLF